MNIDSPQTFLAVFFSIIFIICILAVTIERVILWLYDRHLDKVFALIDSRIAARQSYPKAFSLNLLDADYSCYPQG